MNGRLIRILLVLLAAILAMGLSGCWNRKEVNNILIVLGAGIDSLPDGKIELTAQFFNSAGKSSGGGGGGSEGKLAEASPGQTLVLSASGKTLFDAVHNLQRKLPRTLFWGHNKTVIFGEKAAERGLKNDMDFFLRYSQTRERTRVLVCEGTAKKLLGVKPAVEISSSISLMFLIEQQYGIDRNLKDLAEGILGESHAIALPYVKVGMNNIGSENIKTLRGCALLQDGRMKGYLNSNKTRGMLWAEDHSRWIKLSVPIGEGAAEGEKEGENVNLQVVRSKSSFKPKIEKGVWKLEISVNAQLYVIQNSSDLKISTPEAIRMVEQGNNRLIVRDIEETMEDLQKSNIDVLQVAQMFHRKYPKEWNKVKDRWSEQFPKVEITAKAESHILRTGMYSRP
ncbi:Ger(x)C family spore germination protein [Gorillibacterium timonense]|uniref:Ger(x)C family spore germination protein n=1 Tax=Gorillibacterium timonense TaxID=1689269 RepID=UPI00071DEEFE|nr:Ger(x)C family spore germination protein [Gorillibacterium timonense]